MIKPVDIRTVILLILTGLLWACSGRQGDVAKPSENKIDADELLKTQLRGFDNFRKAEPFYNAGKEGSDSAAFFYGQLLEEVLTPEQRVAVNNRLGYVRLIRNDLAGSLNQFRTSGALAGQMNPEYSGMAAVAFYYMGTIQSRLNRPDSALFYLAQAQRIFRGNPKGNQLFYFLCLEGIANEYHWNLEDYANAEKYYIQAQELLDTGRILNRDSHLFRLSYSMASMYRQKREFDKALIYADRAKSLADSSNLSRSMEISRALLSNIYRDQNRWLLAASLLKLSMDINISSGGSLIDRATGYNNLSFICINLRQFDEAMLYCRKAVQLLNKVSSDDPDPSINPLVLEQLGISYDFTGTVYQETGRQDLAYRAFSESLRLRKLKFGNYHKRVSQINHLIGNHFQRIHQPDTALYYYQQSLITGSEGFHNPDVSVNPNLAQVENNVELIDVLRDKASLMQMEETTGQGRLTNLTRSLNCLKLCDSLIGFIWNSYSNEDSRLYLEDTVNAIYEQGIETAFQIYQIDSSTTCLVDINHFMENSRYRFLSDNFTGIQAWTRARIPEALIQRLREGDYYIKYFSRQKREDPGKNEYYNQKLLEKVREKDVLTDSIDRAFPQLALMKRSISAGTWELLQNKIGGTNRLLIQYFSAARHFYIFSTNGRRSNIVKVEKDSMLLANIDAVMELPDSDPLSRAEFVRFSDNSSGLYEKILKPVLDEYPENETTGLIILPDGSLSRISFDALIRSKPDTSYVNYKDPDYLVKHYSISYAFSSGILVSEKESHKTRRNGVLAFSYGISEKTGGSPASLDWANREVDAIKSAWRGRFFKNEEATETRFKKYAPDYPVLHLALHGRSVVNGNDSTMLIFRRSEGDQDDGFLLTEELLSLHLHTRLVVLSSCESGIGKYFRGEGIYSMARAFANAGCPSMVTTLWQIPDKYTVPIISGFYRGLRKGISPDRALRKSKTDYLDQADQYTSHPRFWASFIPMGNVTDDF